MLDRCCADTIKHYAPREPVEGQTLPCRWCAYILLYERINDRLCGWMPHERTKDWLDREATPEATVAREARATAITMGRYDSTLKDTPLADWPPEPSTDWPR